MENVRISCPCGEIYNTVVSSYIKFFAPPVVYKRAHSSCPKCKHEYVEKEGTYRNIYIIGIGKKVDDTMLDPARKRN